MHLTRKQQLMVAPVIALAGGLAGAAAVTGLHTTGGSSAGARVASLGPEAVARAYFLTLYQCGEQGAGARYDLSTSPERDWTRSTYLRLEKQGGCQPTRPPAAVQARREPLDLGPAAASVLIVAPHTIDRIVLVQQPDGSWKVDTTATDEPSRAPAGPTT